MHIRTEIQKKDVQLSTEMIFGRRVNYGFCNLELPSQKNRKDACAEKMHKNTKKKHNTHTKNSAFEQCSSKSSSKRLRRGSRRFDTIQERKYIISIIM